MSNPPPASAGIGRLSASLGVVLGSLALGYVWNARRKHNNKSKKEWRSEEDGFTVVSWNILAANYCQPHMFKYVTDESVFRFSERSALIMQELAGANADIICLQECDRVDFFTTELRRLGYECRFGQRTGEKLDGLLIAWRSSMFSAIDVEEIVEFNDLCTMRQHAEEQQRFERDNIGFLLGLVHRETSRCVVVANTHMYWNPAHEDVKFLQCTYLVHRMQHFREMLSVDYADPASILCGDFNSVPTSAVYEFLTTGRHLREIPPPEEPSDIKLLFDTHMNKVVRWIRAIGVDAKIFPTDPPSPESFFEMANDENRIIVTRSKSMTVRRGIGRHLLVKSNDSQEAFRQIVEHFGFQFNDEDMFTRCVLCNGLFQTIPTEDVHLYESVPESIRSGRDRSGQIMEFYKCVECEHVYWWGQKSDLEVQKIHKLFPTYQEPPADELSETEEVPSGGNNMNMSFIVLPKDVEQGERTSDSNASSPSVVNVPPAAVEHDDDDGVIVRHSPSSGDSKLSATLTELQGPSRQVSDTPSGQEVRLHASSSAEGRVYTHSLGFSSSYCACNGKEPVYTNFTQNFQGTLDYIFVSKHIECLSVKPIPQLSQPLPHASSPSDHLMLVSQLRLM